MGSAINCNNCGKEVNDYSQTTKFILTDKGSQRAGDSIELSCGCVVDFPDYDLDLSTGTCIIRDEFTRQVFIEFYDEELIMEEDDD